LPRPAPAIEMRQERMPPGTDQERVRMESPSPPP
jgi:hypothetical protein